MAWWVWLLIVWGVVSVPIAFALGWMASQKRDPEPHEVAHERCGLDGWVMVAGRSISSPA